MPFVGDIFSQLKAAADTVVLQEIRDGRVTGVTGQQLLDLIAKARTCLASKGLNKGDRCGLLAANSIRWIALDLAAMAEGLIVVPLYFRQAPAELIAMMKDSTPSLLCCGDVARRDSAELACAKQSRHAAAVSLRRDFWWRRRSCARSPASPRRRSRHHHLYIGYLWRSQRCGADRGQRRIHARLHLGAPRFAHGRTFRARPHLPLPSIQFLRLLDRRLDVHSSRKPDYVEHRPDEDPHRHACNRASLLPERAAIA